jgi:2-hydroxychromene-2-carboxylate isomerase
MTEAEMTEPRTVTLYTDYKSPYAYLAKDPAYAIARDFGARLDVLPYVLNIPDFLGSARLDDAGNVIEQQRTAHQWRRVKYSYMDCRRQARKRGLTIRGTVKIWDTVLGACGLLWAKRQGDAMLRGYHDGRRGSGRSRPHQPRGRGCRRLRHAHFRDRRRTLLGQRAPTRHSGDAGGKTLA